MITFFLDKYLRELQGSDGGRVKATQGTRKFRKCGKESMSREQQIYFGKKPFSELEKKHVVDNGNPKHCEGLATGSV